jgi:hypothetical protein
VALARPFTPVTLKSFEKKNNEKKMKKKQSLQFFFSPIPQINFVSTASKLFCFSKKCLFMVE